MYEHKNNIVKGFTSKYSVHQLVYYEGTNDIYAALQREKQLKTCPHENGEMEPQMEVGAHWENQSWLEWSPAQIGDWIPAKSMREWHAKNKIFWILYVR